MRPVAVREEKMEKEFTSFGFYRLIGIVCVWTDVEASEK